MYKPGDKVLVKYVSSTSGKLLDGKVCTIKTVAKHHVVVEEEMPLRGIEGGILLTEIYPAKYTPRDERDIAMELRMPVNNNNNICKCDFITVILPYGCKCGGK